MWDSLLRTDVEKIVGMLELESKRIGESWLSGTATHAEKDAATTFLAQIGALQITISSVTEESQSQKIVIIVFPADQEQQEVGGDTDSQHKSIQRPIGAYVEAQRSEEAGRDDDPGDDKEHTGWLEQDNDSTSCENDVNPRETSSCSGVKSSTPAEKHPCCDCDAVLPTTWELDLHRIKNCKKIKASSIVFNCDLCTNSYRTRPGIIRHLVQDHGIPSVNCLARLSDLQGTVRQKWSSKSSKPVARTIPQNESLKRNTSTGRKARRKSERLQTKLKKKKRGKPKKRKQTKLSSEELLCASKNEVTPSRVELLGRHKPVVSSLDIDLDTLEGPKPGIDQEQQGKLEKILDTSVDLKADFSSQSSSDEGSQMESSAGNVNRKPHLYESEPQANTSDIHIIMRKRDASNDIEDINETVGVAREEIGCEDGEKKTRCEDELKQIGSEEGEGKSSCEHELKQDDLKHICYICKKSFKKRSMLAYHMGVHYSNENFKCSTCGRVSNTKGAFKQHVLIHQRNADGVTYRCMFCLKTYAHELSYKRHLHSHFHRLEGYTCDICGATFAMKVSLKEHVNREHTKEEQFPCNVCGKVLFSKRKLTRHMYTHNEKTWKCNECGMAFSYKELLTAHQRNVHDESQRSLCEICGASFKNLPNLKEHMNTTHTDTYRFSCKTCGRLFKRSSHLYAHMKIHTDERPFKCDLCEKRFRNSTKKQVHMDWHNNVRRYICELCGKSFLTKGNLTKHQHVHTHHARYTCLECERGFSNYTSLRKHLAKAHQIIVEKMFGGKPAKTITAPDVGATASTAPTDAKTQSAEVKRVSTHEHTVPSLESVNEINVTVATEGSDAQENVTRALLGMIFP